MKLVRMDGVQEGFLVEEAGWLGLQLCKAEDEMDIPGEMRLPNLQG